MADGTSPHPLTGDLHELAEGLQAAASYLGAARIRSESPAEHALTANMIDKAKGEIVRAQTAFHRLRVSLSLDTRDERETVNTLAKHSNIASGRREISEKSRG